LKSLLPKKSPGAQRTAVAEDLQRLVAKNSFLLFLSEQPHNPRMWAQYGGGHEGIMLELDCRAGELGRRHTAGFFLRVQYDKTSRVDLSTRSLKRRGSLDPSDVREIMTHKGPDWSHEQEWRLLLPRELCHTEPATKTHPAQLRLLNDKMKAFLPIEPECITKVVLGYRSSPQLLNTVLQIKAAKKAPWQVTRAILSLDSHRFDEELIEV
jgi:hypothetical protein